MMVHSNALNTNQIMRQVIYALVLGISAAYYFFGWGVILQITLAMITAVAVESTFLALENSRLSLLLVTVQLSFQPSY